MKSTCERSSWSGRTRKNSPRNKRGQIAWTAAMLPMVGYWSLASRIPWDRFGERYRYRRSLSLVPFKNIVVNGLNQIWTSLSAQGVAFLIYFPYLPWIWGTFFRQFALMLSALVSNDFPPFGAASQSLVFMINFGATGQNFNVKSRVCIVWWAEYMLSYPTNYDRMMHIWTIWRISHRVHTLNKSCHGFY